jgi:hypothetical protein
VIVVAFLCITAVALLLGYAFDRIRAVERKIKSIVDEEAPRCSCGFAASIGGRDPDCPKHGQHTDRR